MPKYICLNKDCRLFDKVLLRNSTLQIVDGVARDSGKTCPKCGEKCARLVEKGMPTAIGDNIYSGEGC